MKDNKLIAEFMGYSQPHPNFPTTTYWYKEGKEPLAVLLFDTDWNWLMEVVDKIEGIVNDKGNNYRVVIQNETCIIDNTNIISSPNCASKIQATYKAVVEFIKWYNNESNN